MGAVAGLEELARSFWTWRAERRPRTPDDVPRIERPADWCPEWSAEAIRKDRAELRRFEAAYGVLDATAAEVPDRVDHRLLGAAIARVRWELQVLASWRRDPGFYIDQSAGVVFDLLLEPPPFTPARANAVLGALERIPAILDAALANLDGHAVAQFARWTTIRFGPLDDQLRAAMRELAGYLPPGQAARLPGAADEAARALRRYIDHLDASVAEMAPAWAPGRDCFAYFLNEVALLPFTPAQLVDLARAELDRVRAAAAWEKLRGRTAPPPEPTRDVPTQITRQRRAEEEVRRFYQDNRLLTVPPKLPRYLNAPVPGYLAPLARLGIPDDLTAVSRRDQDAVRYVPDRPVDELGYFDRAERFDPRLGIAHEGAHHRQLTMSWRHPRPSRRHYYDSAPNEGIACYNEELLLATGLYDDSPHSRARVLDFMRLRALRAPVDVGIACGDLGIDDAAAILAEQGGLDRSTAQDEAVFFASTPGQASAYQAGKSQVVALLSAAVARAGDEFDLRAFHDFLWLNGNVPLALLQWEYLDDRSALDRVDELTARRAPE